MLPNGHRRGANAGLTSNRPTPAAFEAPLVTWAGCSVPKSEFDSPTMKNALIAAASLAAIAAVVPAAAQAQDAAADNIGAYVNLNYAHADAEGANFETLQGRVGYRFHRNFGV